MKKFILPILTTLLLSIIILTLTTTISTAAPNLSGTWSMDGDSFESKQTDNSITIIGKDPAKPAFEGTIIGNTVQGTQHLVAEGCPSLDKDVPASGTISEDGTTITVKYTSPQFDRDGCFDLPGTEREHTISYTRTSLVVSTPSPTPSPTQAPKEDNQKIIKPPSDKATVGDRKEFVEFFDGLPFISIFNTDVASHMVTVTFLTPDDFKRFKSITGQDIEGSLNRPPTITAKDEQKAWAFEPEYIGPDSGEKMRVSNLGKVQYKSSVSQEWLDVEVGDFISERSVVKGDWLKLRLDIELTDKVPSVLSLSNFRAEVNPTSVNLQEGEIEFKSLGDIKTHPAFTVKTDNAQISTKDTHFWVSYDKDKKYTLVGVYEGEVEVKTKDGKVTTVSPNGDPSTSSGQGKPGIMVVSRELSPLKLAIGAIILVIIMGVVTRLLKRKGMKSKKKGSQKAVE